MNALLKRIAQVLLGEYQLIRIYYRETESPELHPPIGVELRAISGTEIYTNDQTLRDHTWYGESREQSRGFGLWSQGDLVAACWLWTSRHPNLPRRFAAIEDDEAVLMDIVTAKASRGRGYAGLLIDFATREMHKAGYRKLWTWIWHSNTPSIRAFSKANWTYSHFQMEFRFPATRRVVTLRSRTIGARTNARLAL